MQTPYDVLGVRPDADEKAIASAFREAAKACHPDLNPENRAAEAQFKAVVAARNALNDPEKRALYRFVELSRRHERRHWMITIASCTISALVSAGLVGMFQKQSVSEPMAEERASDPVANSNAESGEEPRFALAARSTDAAPQSEPGPSAALPDVSAGREREQDGSRENLAALGMAQAPAAPAIEPLRPELLREDAASPPRHSFHTRRGPKMPPHAFAGRNLKRKNPGTALLSLLGRAVRPRSAEARPHRPAIRSVSTAESARLAPAAGPGPGCWTHEGGMRSTPCGMSGN